MWAICWQFWVPEAPQDGLTDVQHTAVQLHNMCYVLRCGAATNGSGSSKFIVTSAGHLIPAGYLTSAGHLTSAGNLTSAVHLTCAGRLTSAGHLTSAVHLTYARYLTSAGQLTSEVHRDIFRSPDICIHDIWTSNQQAMQTAQNSFAKRRLATAINLSDLPTVLRSGGSDSDASEDVALGTPHSACRYTGAGCWRCWPAGRRSQQASRKGRYRHTSLHGVIYTKTKMPSLRFCVLEEDWRQREIASPVYELPWHTSTPVCLQRAWQAAVCGQAPWSVKHVDKYTKAVTRNTLP